MEHLRFLIVDDNQYMRAIVAELLRAFGARHVMEAADGGEALRRAEFWSPDIVICDYAMELDGVTLTRRLRRGQTKLDPTLPVILMTGHTEPSRVISARDAGISEFLAKPLSAETLFSKIAAVIDRPRDFARSPDYFGPCRRRRLEDNFSGLRRRASDRDEEFTIDDAWRPAGLHADG